MVRSGVTCLLLLLLMEPAYGSEKGQFSGYLKSLWISAKTALGPEEDYWLAINRWRFEYQQRFGRANIEIHYNHELRLGDYLDTFQYQLQRDLPPKPYWHIQTRYRREAELEARHGFYRATLTVPLGPMEARLGRQQINWARTFLWSSFDRFNPYDPLQLEPDERQGVDGILLRWPIDTLQTLEIAWAGQHTSDNSAYGIRWQQHWGQTDWDFLLSRFGDTEAVGVSFGSQWHGVGLQAEYTFNNIKHHSLTNNPLAINGLNRRDHYNDLVLSGNYSFSTQTTVTFEGLYRGIGAENPRTYDRIRQLTQQQTTLARHYWGLIIQQVYSPLTQINFTALYNADDHSSALLPEIIHSPGGNEDLALRIGGQWYLGSSQSEYGPWEPLLFAEIKWYY